MEVSIMISIRMRNISLRLLMTILSVITAPLFAYANAQVTVTTANLNVREAAGISNKIISQVHLGDTFEIIQTKDSWDQIRLLSNQTGWIYNAFTTPAENIKATIAAKSLNVREKPSLSSAIVGKLALGTKVTIHEEKAGWAKMVSDSGVEGWVSKYYITKDATTAVPRHEKKSLSQSARVAITSDNNKVTQSARVASPSDNNKATQSTRVATPSNKNKNMVTQAIVPNSQEPLKGKTIVLDPGHGGIDSGATSIIGTHEKTLTLATAKVVEQKLEAAGATVMMTRTDDTYIPLEQRASLSRQYHADAFISFHYNWSNNPSVGGLTDFYYQTARDTPLATDILMELIQTTGLNNVGTRFDNLSVLRNNTQPSTLIELGFLSNKQDDAMVESDSYRDHVAEGVYLGLLEFWGIDDSNSSNFVGE